METMISQPLSNSLIESHRALQMGVFRPMAFLQDHQWRQEEHRHMLGGQSAQGGAPQPHIFPNNTESKYSTQKGDPQRKGTALNSLITSSSE